ncbi:MAG: SHOCT domain-containing protein [Actinomycetes bacterium]
MPRGRRPLLRAAVVGGSAYYAGKKRQEGQTQEATQDDQTAAPQQPAPQPAVPTQAGPPPASPPASGGLADQLTQLKSLLDAGALSPAEYEAAKQRVLQGG